MIRHINVWGVKPLTISGYSSSFISFKKIEKTNQTQNWASLLAQTSTPLSIITTTIVPPHTPSLLHHLCCHLSHHLLATLFLVKFHVLLLILKLGFYQFGVFELNLNWVYKIKLEFMIWGKISKLKFHQEIM